MGLIIGIIALIVIGICSVADFSGVKSVIGEIIAIGFFWWVGSLFASPAEVLSFSWSMSTVIAGFFYAIAGMLIIMKLTVLFK